MMSVRFWWLGWIGLSLGLTGLTLAAFAAETRSTVPAAPGERGWQQLADPATAGWSTSGLEATRRLAEEQNVAAVMVVEDGVVVAAWGDVERRYATRSLRKSLVAAMVGWYVESGAIRLDATLAELGIDDVQGLTAAERGAQVRHLLAARSGVYHPAAKEPPGMKDRRPARDSHPPGSFWFYNNWDFNLVGTLLERAAGQGMFELFAERIARPLGMEDFRVADGSYELEPRQSIYPAWELRISTRDLARFGQLILDRGSWAGQPVLAAGWVDQLTTLHSDLGDGGGYGWMWWVNPGRREFRPSGELGPIATEPHVAAQGAGGHTAIAFPGRRLVIVVRGDTDNGGGIDERLPFALADRILAAKSAPPGGARGELVALAARPFPNARPAPAERQSIPLEPSWLTTYPGVYLLPDGAALEVEVYAGRLFASLTGKGQTEIFAETPRRFFSRSAPVVLEFGSAAADGNAVEVTITLRGQSMTAQRRGTETAVER